MISLYIYGCRPEIYERAKEIGVPSDHIFTDDRPNGGTPLYVAKKAWLDRIRIGETHRCVLQDDVAVCDNFMDHLQAMVKFDPAGVWSLFPLEFIDFPEKGEERHKKEGIFLRTTYLSGCAIMMPVDYCRSIYYAEEGIAENDDEIAIMDAYHHKNAKLYTTIPATVQHLGDDCKVKSATTKYHGAYLRTPFFKQEGFL